MHSRIEQLMPTLRSSPACTAVNLGVALAIANGIHDPEVPVADGDCQNLLRTGNLNECCAVAGVEGDQHNRSHRGNRHLPSLLGQLATIENEIAKLDDKLTEINQPRDLAASLEDLREVLYGRAAEIGYCYVGM